MANLICVRLNKGDAPSWGFRLQGGKDFGTPLVVQKVIGGSPAERAGLIAGDTVIKINNTDVLHLRHKDAQDVILRAGNAFDVAIQRGGSTWKPNVVPVGSISAVPSAAPLSNNISPVTHTSLAASKQDSIGSIGTGHNVSAKPYHQLNGGPKLVNKQYNSPLPIYSEQSIAETLSAQTEVLANGVLGVNFKKNEKSYDAANSEVFRMVQEADKEPKDYEPEPDTSSSGVVTAPLGIAGLKHVSAPENKPAPPTPQLPPGQNICADCERLIVGVFVRIKDKNLHVECFKCATCGSSLKNVGYYNLNNKLYCDVHAKLAARSNPPAPNLQPITIPPGSKIPSGTISAALSSHSLPSPSSLSPNTNYSAAPYQPGSSYTTPKPFSSVTSPLSPIYTPISPTSTPYTGRSGVKPGAPYRESRGVQNIVWPPILNEPDIPTASPLYFPPPSQVQAHQKLLLDNTEIRTNEKGITTEEEMSFINEFAKERNMSLSSSEVYNITGRRSAIECSETISDTIDRQILVESIVQSRPKSPSPIEPKPRRTSGDVSVTFTISEAQLKQGACQNTSSDDYESKEVKVCPKGTLTHSAIGNVNSKQGAYKSVSSEVSEIKELKTCLKETQSQSLASMYEKKIKVENTIPHKWESPMVTALTVASSKPYTNLSEVKEQHDTFSEIPTTTSHTPLASALVVAPAVPFTPACMSTLEPVPLPDETVPYFPPEHPIISQPKDTDGEKKEKKVAKKVYGKKKEEVDLLFQDLPTPPVEKISLLAALTTAPDRPYSPFNPDSATPTTTSHEEVTSKAETNINTEIQKTKAVVATKTLEDYSFISHTSKPILKTYVPFPTYQVNEVSNTCTTVDEENQIREETSTSVNKHASEKSEVSKNVQSSENITNVCAGLPPMIQVVRSTFETSTDKVQMEMSCQYLGDSVPQRQIIERHTTTDVSQQKAVEHRDTEEHKTSSEIIHNKNKEHQKSTHATSQQKAIEKRALTQHKEQQKQFQNIVDMPSKSALAAVVSSQVTESVLLQKATSNIESERHSVTTEQFRTSKKAHKEPLTVLKPGESSLSVPQISFQPVIEDACSSTTFSSRPGSLTPSMINKPAPVLPYYQASLVATECTPVGTNLFDPTSPAISRSPSPCIVRPPSPFATPSAALRPVSPAQGPPPNPLQSHKSVYEIKREGKVQDALAHIQTFIPQHQSKAYHARTESYKEEPPKEWKVLSTNDDKSITVRESAKEADLFEASKLENTSVQCKRDGNLQIQRKTHTTEEYEHQQKSKMIQIETLSSSTKKLEEKKATASLTGGQVAVGFHVTNPQPLKSPFRGADGASIPETQSKIPKRVQQTDSGTKTNCPTVNSSASASVAPAKICPNKNVTKPSISQPNLGTGGGRQAGAIGVAPKRGRGVLNLAATPGSRVPLCAQCNANIRGPFITALGKIWCPDHFICATPSCRRPLHDLGFVEEHGQLYCEYCFEQYLAPPCSKCNTKIKGDCLKAIGRNFHPECFNCVYCGKLFGNSPFFLEDAQPYCETDWNELFTTKCFACGFPVEAGDRWVEALSNNYHSQCFNCTMCKKNLEGQSFFAKGGRPFCKNHAR